MAQADQMPGGWVVVNGELVARGLAEVRASEPDNGHDAWLRQLEDETREAGAGMHDPGVATLGCYVGGEIIRHCHPAATDPPDRGDKSPLGQVLDIFFGSG